ncbi:hypothetical protein B1B04_24415 [Lysinibacillus sp. KCTC 33748]|uniref:hypothetical protein n=1 Tax=unclassified Lysinibacillus TaxID=2636778 RepID=UPI0009A63A89|nr:MULTISPECIES: hypothetical protein [unclassified Lysinibacillus]OXS66092.1 hypothetical protein B1B04_24415 [Lysinibacillus sp. KCTC 33748]SKC18439.1 hypothetical protein SAMN06295926_13724 [Lysinibacillus sp. AC-3]
MPRHGEIISDEIICEREQCRKTFTWLYQYTERGNIDAFVIPKPKVNESIVRNYDEQSKQAMVYCPHEGCGKPNYFKLNI